MNLTNLKNYLFIMFFVLGIQQTSAQIIQHTIINNDCIDPHKLKIKPVVNFFIPPTEIADYLPINVNVEAQYQTKLLDLRAVGMFGSLTGGSVGATFNLVNKVKSKNHKFVLKEEGAGRNKIKQTYFKSKANLNYKSGPCLDFKIGNLKKAGLITQTDFGWDFQWYARATAKLTDGGREIKSARNGMISLRFQGVIATSKIDVSNYFEIGAGRAVYTEKEKMAVGFQVNPTYTVSPWRRVSIYGNLPMGYMRYMGIDTKNKDTQKGAPLFNISIGMQVGL